MFYQKIAAILATDDEYGIGKDGKLPWPHNKKDMERFRNLTTGHVVIMGRKTWDSLPKKPLPNRINFVVSNDPDFDPEGATVIRDTNGDLNQAITVIAQIYEIEEKHVFIIGGASLYKQTRPIIDTIYLTRINGTFDCDTFIDQNYIANTALWWIEKLDGLTFYDLSPMDLD